MRPYTAGLAAQPNLMFTFLEAASVDAEEEDEELKIDMVAVAGGLAVIAAAACIGFAVYSRCRSAAARRKHSNNGGGGGGHHGRAVQVDPILTTN